jgi:hypothetical protein
MKNDNKNGKTRNLLGFIKETPQKMVSMHKKGSIEGLMMAFLISSAVVVSFLLFMSGEMQEYNVEINTSYSKSHSEINATLALAKEMEGGIFRSNGTAGDEVDISMLKGGYTALLKSGKLVGQGNRMLGAMAADSGLPIPVWWIATLVSIITIIIIWAAVRILTKVSRT